MSNMKHMETSTNVTAPQTPLGFEEWIKDLNARSFDERADSILDELDASGRELHFAFQRHEAPSSGRGHRSYRAEVARIPVMGRSEEQRFAMGVELLWRRLQRVRRAAGFSEEKVTQWPGREDTKCLTCAPADELDCFGCAPGECDAEIRAQLRGRTQDLVLARNEMVERHLYIVFRLLERYRHAGVPIEDMIQEANESLFRAVQGFDFRRGVRFKTYAGYWVNQAFLNAIYNQSRTVRVPAYIQKAMKKIGEAANQVEGGLHNVEGLSAATSVDRQLVANTLRGNRYTLSLNRPADGEDGAQMVDFVEADPSASPSPELGETTALSGHLEEAVGRLSQREQTVLGMRFGLSGEKVSTLAEVGKRLGISLERVRQIQRAALDKLRSGQSGQLLEQFV